MTNVISLISALAALIAAIGTITNRKKIGEIHVLVNSRMADVQARVKQLTETLDHHGVAVPPKPEGT